MSQGLYMIGAASYGIKRSGPKSLASGDVTAVAAVAGMKIRVLWAIFSITTAAAVRITNGAGGSDLSMTLNLVAAPVLPYNPGGWWETTKGAALVVNSGALIVGTAEFGYVEIPAAVDSP